ncbi:MAG TPA: phosphate ABC transporter permease PstA, partial [Nitrospiraceae bacterium]|nr:phosphate ABC transporter permease PstA [Nitrospiraceae bacterium]
MKAFWRSGEVFVWLTASGVAISLLMMTGLLGLIMVNGLGQFWPQNIDELQLKDGRRFIGEVMGREIVPGSETRGHPEGQTRIRVRVGNRDTFGFDFKWVDEADVLTKLASADLVKIERREWGPAYGRLVGLYDGPGAYRNQDQLWSVMQSTLARIDHDRRAIEDIEKEVGTLNHEIETLRLKRRALTLDGTMTSNESERDEEWKGRISTLEEMYQRHAADLERLYKGMEQFRIGLRLSDGRDVHIPLSQILTVSTTNTMTFGAKGLAYLQNLWSFLSGEPRETNTEGGIFPAIFGTVLMVFLMTIVVAPFGVLAAVYLREYAKQGLLVRMVRVAVNNLAGVPSIVFGVFGLGCFIYAAGGTIDQLFFPEALPNPTFGTGGILWASLTLALLTVPVVIVATEEGLSSVPREFREGSIGLGATKFETLRHVIVPCALPGILTGLILAMARAAGEVAPLMLTGVVKLAPSLPLDAAFPFLHLDR